MSGFLKVSSSYHEASKFLLDRLTDIFTERLSSVLTGFEVELKVPPGSGFTYERHIRGKICGVYFWLSNPAGEVPMTMCKFEIKGQDQFGIDFKDLLRENDLITKIPWQKFTPPTNHEIKTLF